MSMRFPALVAGLFIASAAVAQPAGPEIGNAWARATPPGAQEGVAYMTIRVAGSGSSRLGLHDGGEKAELHTMSMQGMVMKMSPLPGLDIPAGQPVTLKPGGEHVMLMGLAQPLREGQTFPLTLNFAKAGPRTITVTVEKPGAIGPLGRRSAEGARTGQLKLVRIVWS